MNLLMLTKFYPYGTGEAFIENEIKVLSQYYERVVVIACEAPVDDERERFLPENVKAYKVDACPKSKDVTRGIRTFFSANETFASEKKVCGGVKNEAFLSYFEAKSQRVFNQIMKNHYLDEVVKEPYVLYSYWFFMTARVGMLIAERYTPVKTFTRAHRYDLYEEKNALNYLPYREAFLDFYDYVFPCSENGTNHLKAKFPEKTANVKTAYLGTLDHGMGCASNDGVFRIVSCSRIEPVKRVPLILDALALLDDTGCDIGWTHIGGSTGYEDLCAAAKKKLKHIKYIFPGNMLNEDVMDMYANQPFDLLVNVSSSEGLPVSIMEAISFGIPCIATDVGGTSEIVYDGVTGKLIPGNFEVDELSKLILEFIQNKNIGDYRLSCRKFWEEHFQAETNYRKLYEALKIF